MLQFEYMKRTFIKWLPIIFGCHCRLDRSFYYHGKQFPICARCTGELIGIFLGIALFAIFHISLFGNLFLLIPLILDGTLQLKTNYESTNIRRFITGTMFGYALVSIFILTTLYAYDTGAYIRNNF